MLVAKERPARWGDTITRELGTEDFKRPGLRALNSQWLTGSGQFDVAE